MLLDGALGGDWGLMDGQKLDRDRPNAIKGRVTLGVAGIVTVLLILASCAVLKGTFNARATPIVRPITVELSPRSGISRPIRVAFLSDIHIGNLGMDEKRLSRIVDQVNATRPDLILLGGDFVTGHDKAGVEARAAEFVLPLSKLHAPMGIIAVLGNHDYWTNEQVVRSDLSKANVLVLENQAVRRGSLAIVGVGDRFSGHDNIAASLSSAAQVGGRPVILTHSPDLAPDLPSDIPLVLAGHTHCGQVVLPFVGPLMSRAPFDHWRRLYLPRYRCGLIRDGGKLTVVTAGVGSGTAPVRIGAMPDWWLLTIYP